MDSSNKKSIEDIRKNLIFREYKKDENQFIATNNFFISEEIDDKIEFIRKDLYSNNVYLEKITPCYENIYVSQDGYRTYTDTLSYLDQRYINLVVISNISFNLDETNIFQRDIVKRIIKNDKLINENLFDSYESTDNIKTLEIPTKYNDKKIILDNVRLNKKYLFKVGFNESYQNIGIVSNSTKNITKSKSQSNLILV